MIHSHTLHCSRTVPSGWQVPLGATLHSVVSGRWRRTQGRVITHTVQMQSLAGALPSHAASPGASFERHTELLQDQFVPPHASPAIALAMSTCVRLRL